MYVCVYVYICIYVYMYMYMYVCMYVCVYMYVCIYIHTYRSREESGPRRFPKHQVHMAERVLPTAQLAEGSARMQEVSGLNPRLGGLGGSPFQVSGGISALQSWASGLQSTTQGNSIRIKKTPPS